MTITEQEEVHQTGSTRPDETIVVYEPGPSSVDITPDQDGGVMKEILREGSGTKRPMTGDKVFVHYVGTLTDGTKFDSSRDRDQMFEFNLGTGSVIKAWDLGVATMRLGELAVLLCKSEYAYGSTGSPPKIPPNATLVFHVELFDWKGEDVSVAKDEGVVRSQLQRGTGYQMPKDGATCEIHIVGHHGERQFEERDVQFILGEGPEVGVVDGVEQALKKFKSGERSLLRVKAKYAYGVAGCEEYGIPPNTDLEYTVELKRFEKAKESWEMDATEKFEQCELSKAKGTQFFKADKFKMAIRYYQRILDLLKSEESLKDKEAETRQSLMLVAHLNLAMCHLKVGADYEAMLACDEALKLDPKNEKGLFRRATAHANLQNFDQAIADFKAVLAVDPQNKAAQGQIASVLRRQKNVLEKEKHMYAGMFSKFAAADAKKESVCGGEEVKVSTAGESSKCTEDDVTMKEEGAVETSASS